MDDEIYCDECDVYLVDEPVVWDDEHPFCESCYETIY